MTTTYRDAAVRLWGPAGAYAHDSYTRSLPLYPGLPESLPIVIGITAYGHCIGLTRPDWTTGPRITLFSSLFAAGTHQVDDVMIHEMLHAWLAVKGEDIHHDGAAWYSAVRRLSPAVLGTGLDVKRGSDRKSVRVPNPDYGEGDDTRKTVVRKVPVPGAVQHADVARWPQAFRPADYDWGPPMACPSY